MKKHIPNAITSLNLASGFLSVIFASEGHLLTASWLILAAMIFDFLDGFSARALKAYSPVGRELDSLADLVSFGVAPAFILFTILRGILPADTIIFKALPFLAATIMPVSAAIRLAVFNLDTTQTTSFRGLPTPANALAVIAVIIAKELSDSSFALTVSGSAIAIISLSVVLSLLMVSRLPLLSLKFSHLRIKGNEGRFLMIAMIVLLISISGLAALPFVIPVYITASLLSNILNW